MEKIKISHDFGFYKYAFFFLGIIILSFSLINNRYYEIPFGLIFLIPYYFFQAPKIISYNLDETILIGSGNKVIKIPFQNIKEISILYSRLNRENVWKLYYEDDNHQIKSVHFVPVLYTFNSFKMFLKEKGYSINICENFQFNRIW